MTVSPQALQEGLSRTLDGTNFESLGDKYEGTDRISAFDRVLGTLPYKGQVLNGLAAWWFEETKGVVPNHVLDVPDPNVMVGIECAPLPVEMVVRSYITGVTSTSIWTHYNNGTRVFCGHELPDGLKKHQKLPDPILTPSTKAEKGDHDVSVSREEILAMGRISAEDFDAAAGYAMALFAHGQKVCAERGLILVDTKYEFGKTPAGKIVDKEYVRRWLASNGYKGDGPVPTIPDEVRVEASRRYIQACDQIRGTAFTPDTTDPLPRIAKNLGLKGS
jgi:phosphoribosylaminoimidazole-succinocarboxamide synthase